MGTGTRARIIQVFCCDCCLPAHDAEKSCRIRMPRSHLKDNMGRLITTCSKFLLTVQVPVWTAPPTDIKPCDHEWQHRVDHGVRGLSSSAQMPPGSWPITCNTMSSDSRHVLDVLGILDRPKTVPRSCAENPANIHNTGP